MSSILYWNQLTFDNQSFFPVFSFHPTLDFLRALKEKGSSFRITIQGTNGIYDGTHFARFDQFTSIDSCSSGSSSNTTNSPLYIGFLESIPFTIYPMSNGLFTWNAEKKSHESFQSKDISSLPTAPTWSQQIHDKASHTPPFLDSVTPFVAPSHEYASVSDSTVNNDLVEFNQYLCMWILLLLLVYFVFWSIEILLNRSNVHSNKKKNP